MILKINSTRGHTGSLLVYIKKTETVWELLTSTNPQTRAVLANDVLLGVKD